MIKGSDFVFESVDLLDYKLHRVRLNRGGSYIKSPKWLENKKTSMMMMMMMMMINAYDCQ